MTNRVNTLVVEIKVGHDKLSKMQSLPYDDLILFQSRAIYKTHHETGEFIEKLEGGWYPAQLDSPDGSGDSTGSYTIDKLEPPTPSM